MGGADEGSRGLIGGGGDEGKLDLPSVPELLALCDRVFAGRPHHVAANRMLGTTQRGVPSDYV